MRLLVAPWLFSGHLIPHLGLAAELRSRGHEVTVYAEAAAAPHVRQAGCRHRVMPTGGAETDFVCSTTTAQVTRALTRLAKTVAPDLLGVLSSGRFEGVVTDGSHLGAALAAEASGLPWASLAVVPAELSPAVGEAAQAKIPTTTLRRALGLSPTDGHSLAQCVSPHLFLLPWASDFDLGPRPPQAVHVGPLHWDGATRAAPRWVAGLREDKPVVLVGMSSIPFRVFAPYAEDYLQGAVDALEALDVQGIVTLGNASTAPPRASKKVRVVRFVPHGVLLPRLSALVTHGGWGTVGRALCGGVPLVVVPFALDQPANAELVERKKVGFSLPIDAFTAEDLHDRLTRLLSPGAPQRARVQALAKKLSLLSPASRAADLFLGLVGGARPRRGR